MLITKYHPQALDLIGMIPDFLYPADPRPAAEQFNEHYAFGGGWRPMDGWETHHSVTGELIIRYPGDPPYQPVAQIEFRSERVWVYSHAWVAIEQPDGSVEISRMD